MTISTLTAKGVSNCEIARMLGITEGSVRYQSKRMESGAVDGRSQQESKASSLAEAVEVWRQSRAQGVVNLAELHDWLVIEHGYGGSLRSVQRYWKRTYPKPAIRARRRVETPAAAQSQVDWAHFPGVLVGGERTDLLALHMVLSHSRYAATIWSRHKDQLSWLHCHTEGFKRVGGVTPSGSTMRRLRSSRAPALGESSIQRIAVMPRSCGSMSTPVHRGNPKRRAKLNVESGISVSVQIRAGKPGAIWPNCRRGATR